MYSQKEEEKYILNYFKNVSYGRFLDIGAYNGVKYSNTRALFEKGWRGVVVDPAPTSVAALTELYGDVKGMAVVDQCIGEYSTPVDFYESPNDAYSSTEIEHVQFWTERGIQFERHTVPMVTWRQLLGAVGADFYFVKIDAEGMSVRLLELMPFDKLPNLLCVMVEHENQFTRCIQHFLIHGFNTFICEGDNIIAFKKSEG